MTEQDQKIEIAELCGWSQIEDRSESLMMSAGFSVFGYPPQGAVIGRKEPLPDFLYDLNAMFTPLKDYSWEIGTCGHGYFVWIFLSGGIAVTRETGPELCPAIAKCLLRATGRWKE